MLDSNLIIYAARPEYPGLRRLIAARSPAVSTISVVEVLGYHKLSEEDRRHFEAFFAAAKVLPIPMPWWRGRCPCVNRERCRWVILSWRRRHWCSGGNY